MPASDRSKPFTSLASARANHDDEKEEKQHKQQHLANPKETSPPVVLIIGGFAPYLNYVPFQPGSEAHAPCLMILRYHLILVKESSASTSTEHRTATGVIGIVVVVYVMAVPRPSGWHRTTAASFVLTKTSYLLPFGCYDRSELSTSWGWWWWL